MKETRTKGRSGKEKGTLGVRQIRPGLRKSKEGEVEWRQTGPGKTLNRTKADDLRREEPLS